METCKVVIVDDDTDQLKTINRIIEKHHPDYLVYQANSGKSVLNILTSIKPDIILSDWEMPEMNGIELIEKLKRNKETHMIPVIMVTGVMTDVYDMKKAMEAGANDFIRKPVEEIELLARINSAIRIAKKHRELILEKEKKIAEQVKLNNEVNSFLNNVLKNINGFTDKLPDNRIFEKQTNKLKSEIENRISGSGWNNFKSDFNSLHPDFARNLIKTHNDLTPTEIDICKMIRIGLSNKELASLMCVTPESMRVSRSRLRKKLRLETVRNLQTYLNTI